MFVERNRVQKVLVYPVDLSDICHRYGKHCYKITKCAAVLSIHIQEVALNGEFTIREVCHYFGRIYGMEKNSIDARIDQLLTLLDLKNSNQYINTLRCGYRNQKLNSMN